MKVEYDEIYEEWVVWLIAKNTMKELYRGTKRNCDSYMKKKLKKGKN